MKPIDELKSRLKELKIDASQVEAKYELLQSIFRKFRSQVEIQITPLIFSKGSLKIKGIKDEIFNIEFAGLTVEIKFVILLTIDGAFKGYLTCTLIDPKRKLGTIGQLIFDELGKSDLISTEHLPLNLNNDKDSIEIILKWLERCMFMLKSEKKK
ncbi:MAG: hypothetical protein DID92_2727743024 [Candidatus Nitrotoga sp. SPKER]|nr:MAG: hypothetical protein DID92_2727743024 [Candidatus Nitrotoga sp. SPKER]